MTGSGQGSRSTPPEDDWYGLLDDLPPEEAAAKPVAVKEGTGLEAPSKVPTPVSGLAARPTPDLWDWETNPEPALTVRAPPGTAPVMTPPEPFFDVEDLDLAQLSASLRSPAVDRATPSELDSPVAPAGSMPSRAIVEVEEIDALGFNDIESWQFDPTASKTPVPTRPASIAPASASSVNAGSGAGRAPARFKATQAFRPSPPPEPPEPPEPKEPAEELREQGSSADMRERFEAGDFAGALLLSEMLLQSDPGDSDAEQVCKVSRQKLNDIYSARLGDLRQTPRVIVPPSELMWLTLDHRAGFLISLIDGALTLEEILDVSAMPPHEVLRTLYTFSVQRVIELRPAKR